MSTPITRGPMARAQKSSAGSSTSRTDRASTALATSRETSGLSAPIDRPPRTNPRRRRRSGLLQQALLLDQLEVEGAVADRLEEDGDAIAVVALDFAVAPLAVGDGGAEREGALDAGFGLDQAGVAVVAVAAGRLVLLAEVAEDEVAAAAVVLGVGAHHFQPRLLVVGAILGGPAGEKAADRLVLWPVEDAGGGEVSIAPGATDLLVVGVDRVGEAGVEDEADVRLVDPHPEGGGGDDRLDLVVHEGVLQLAASLGTEAGVVGLGGD